MHAGNYLQQQDHWNDFGRRQPKRQAEYDQRGKSKSGISPDDGCKKDHAQRIREFEWTKADDSHVAEDLPVIGLQERVYDCPGVSTRNTIRSLGLALGSYIW